MKKLSALISLSYVTILSSALAAEELLHDVITHELTVESTDHAETKGGLPQFDPEWFASQIFWLAISFAVLYFIFAKKTLPDISGVIENRKNHIQSDLETAEKLTAEADSVHDAYHANINKAQNDAAEAIKDVENKAKLKIENALNDFRQKSDAALKQAEKNIANSKSAAMGDMNQIAVEAATQAVEKIIGTHPENNQIQAIVESMNGKAKAA